MLLGATINAFTYGGRLGYYLDADLGYYYMRSRVLNPGIGRFLSIDPLGLADNTKSPYVYVRNNPSRITDPSGLQPGITASPAAPPQRVGTCGAGASFINWVADPVVIDNNTSGFIVQKVNVTVSPRPCGGGAFGSCKVPSYWEVWRVVDGQIQATPPHDTFSLPDMTMRDGGASRECLRGKARVVGLARFVNINDIRENQRDLPNSKPYYWQKGIINAQSPGCAWLQFTFQSGSLSHTTHDPSRAGFWNKAWETARPAEVVQHSLNTSWDCCPSPCETECPNNPTSVSHSP